MQGKLTVAAIMPEGRIGLVEEDIPETAAGCVLLEVKSSLVSPGTELRGWRGLAQGETRRRLRRRPQALRLLQLRRRAGGGGRGGEAATGRPGRGHRRRLRQARHPRPGPPEPLRRPARQRDLRPGSLRDALGHGGAGAAPRRPRFRRALLRGRAGAAGPADGPSLPARRQLRHRLGYDRSEAGDSSRVGYRRAGTLRGGRRGGGDAGVHRREGPRFSRPGLRGRRHRGGGQAHPVHEDRPGRPRHGADRGGGRDEHRPSLHSVERRYTPVVQDRSRISRRGLGTGRGLSLRSSRAGQRRRTWSCA